MRFLPFSSRSVALTSHLWQSSHTPLKTLNPDRKIGTYMYVRYTASSRTGSEITAATFKEITSAVYQSPKQHSLSGKKNNMLSRPPPPDRYRSWPAKARTAGGT